MPGLYFEDFEIGKVRSHDNARSVTMFDDIWASCMMLNTQPLHINADFAQRKGIYGKNQLNSMYTLCIVLGQTCTELTRGTLIENIRMNDIKFPRPVFHGDTLYSRTTVLDKSDARPDSGVVDLLYEGLNQHGEVVAICKRTIRVRRRPAPK